MHIVCVCVKNTRKVLNLGSLKTASMFVAGQPMDEIAACLSTKALDHSVVVAYIRVVWHYR